ncbi:MAG: nucleotidyl transferase AbiEii/AbiGii toxin family protein [Candidatus Sabulitectum sp.]|nr:nucleotidyl transferase AbiEii/AbiGii toxin family protein [Candidatus Sabulitectum sp.]
MNSIIESRLAEYNLRSEEARKHALREIVQEIALYSLSLNGFFKNAVFHGGTELRLIHSLPRFSEDLDFALIDSSEEFSWNLFARKLLRTCSNYGLHAEIREQKAQTSSIRKLLLVETSILEGASSGRIPFLRIRLEVDTNPPPLAGIETAFLDFPIPFEVGVMDLSSSFALKCHALLCRPWTKGRDWFDFLWFCSRNIQPEVDLLSSSLGKSGPWAGMKITVTSDWLKKQLLVRIMSIDWEKAKRDISPFLSAEDRNSLSTWRPDLFIHYLNRMS